MFGYCYLTRGIKDYEEYIQHGLWFAESEAVAIAQIETQNKANGVQTKSIEVSLMENMPYDVKVDHLGRLIR